MYNPENYIANVVTTLFVSKQIAFFSFVATWLCLYFRCYWLILKNPNWELAQGPQLVGRVTYSSLIIYSFTLIMYFTLLFLLNASFYSMYFNECCLEGFGKILPLKGCEQFFSTGMWEWVLCFPYLLYLSLTRR